MSKEKSRGTLITPGGGSKEIEFKGNIVTLEELKECVDGYIEMLWLKDGKIMIVNEEGKIHGLLPNPEATLIVNNNGIRDFIVGNALIIDSKFVN